MSLTVTWASSARRDLRQLDASIAKRIVAAIDLFAQTGHGDIQKLRGTDSEWRLRDGDYRARFIYIEGGLRVLRVLHRREAYR